MRQNNILCTYKFYSSKNRRLAIFGVPTSTVEGDEHPEINAIQIFVVICSNKDMFERKAIRKAFDNRYIKDGKTLMRITRHLTGKETIDELVHPKVITLPCTELTTKSTFMNYCHDNFERMEQLVLAVEYTGRTIMANCYVNSHKQTARIDQSSLRTIKTNTKTLEFMEKLQKRDQKMAEEYYKTAEIHNKTIEENKDINPNNN